MVGVFAADNRFRKMEDLARMNVVFENVLGRHTFFGWLDGWRLVDRLRNEFVFLSVCVCVCVCFCVCVVFKN